VSYYAHPTAVIDDDSEIGEGVKIWHFSHIMPLSKIGDGCNIGQNVFVASHVVLGKNVKIQNNVSLYEGVVCEDDVFIGPSAVFTNVVNPRSKVSRQGKYQKTLLRKGSTVGANATILCGIEIGEYAFVGAGSVVTKNVFPYALVVGNPATQVGWMSEHGDRLNFDSNGKAVCKESGECYKLIDNKVKKVKVEVKAKPSHP
jgi:UDP-2-acetamido-3-amino-2,3-dideoxy-glucuronate N-acetyltransferase